MGSSCQTTMSVVQKEEALVSIGITSCSNSNGFVYSYFFYVTVFHCEHCSDNIV